MTPLRLVTRDVPPRTAWALEQAGVHPLLARLFAARGVRGADELDDALARLLPPSGLLGADDAAVLLADAIGAGSRICVVADYDCDGATACAVVIRGLRMLGADPATLSYVVPDRRVHGYGLTPQIVDLVVAQGADVLVTVDNGIASLDGVAHAQAAGLAVVITDHHLPVKGDDGGVVLPAADVIVNPNQPGCGFASTHIAGVGVAFYVLLALRAELRERGEFDAVAGAAASPSARVTPPALSASARATASRPQPRLDTLLDLVALGTVADVVRLDRNNRCLVAQGLKRIRAGRVHAGIAALFVVAGRDPNQASAADFGFAIAPRLNAAGRLADMTLGIECLLSDDATRATELAEMLDTINRERRTIEATMREDAEAQVDRAFALSGEAEPALAVFDPSFHEGVVGIIASRLKDRLHRPSFVFARGQDGALKGSGRSIDGFHLRDALDLVSKRHPGLLLRFGGHSMAAGCTIAAADFATFRAALQGVAREGLGAAAVERTIFSDGPLGAEHFDAATARLLDDQVWGAAFDAPIFCDAIWFGRVEPVGDRVRLAWRLGLDAYNGIERVQMIVVAAE